jgi:hypothetical protein
MRTSLRRSHDFVAFKKLGYITKHAMPVKKIIIFLSAALWTTSFCILRNEPFIYIKNSRFLLILDFLYVRHTPLEFTISYDF